MVGGSKWSLVNNLLCPSSHQNTYTKIAELKEQMNELENKKIQGLACMVLYLTLLGLNTSSTMKDVVSDIN
jgi:hypothetical protein